MRIPRRLPPVIVVTAWLMFVISFFLPATNVLEMGGTTPGTPLTGWQACTSSIAVLGAQPLLVVTQPSTLLFLMFPLINLTMLIAPAVVLAWDNSWLLSGPLLVFGLLPWVFPKNVTGDLFVGFYLWDLSFFMMSIGCILVNTSRMHRL